MTSVAYSLCEGNGDSKKTPLGTRYYSLSWLVYRSCPSLHKEGVCRIPLRDAKIVYSIYENKFDRPFSETFPAKLLWENIQEKRSRFRAERTSRFFARLSGFGHTIFRRLACKLLPKSTKSCGYLQRLQGKPFLTYQDSDTYVDAYNNFL